MDDIIKNAPGYEAFVKGRIAANKQILDNVNVEIDRLSNPRIPVDPRYLVAFPGQTPTEVRVQMLEARRRDRENFEHIIRCYETGEFELMPTKG